MNILRYSEKDMATWKHDQSSSLATGRARGEGASLLSCLPLFCLLAKCDKLIHKCYSLLLKINIITVSYFFIKNRYNQVMNISERGNHEKYKRS